MATLDELNAALGKAIEALPKGLDLSVGSSLSSIPRTNYSANIPPTPSLYGWLQELRATAQVQPVASQLTTVEGRRNQYWREAAEYEKWAFPLFLYLENVDWQQVLVWHEAKWQKNFLQGLRYHMREHQGRYAGRMIKRNDVLPGTTYRVRLTLPIPTPTELARRQFNKGRDLYIEVLANQTAQQQEIITDSRRLLAERLKDTAINLGRYERDQWQREKEWQPDWLLRQAVEPQADRSRGALYPGELGKIVALAEGFWQSWRTFHEAEQKAGGKTIEATLIPTANSPLAHLHPTVQQVATSLFDTNHYPQAIQAACTALEKAIQQKSGQSASVTGTALIGRAFPKDNPLIHLSDDQGEREGYGFLYRGLLQAIRNHYAHNLTEIPAARALEWLSFISALFYKLGEAQPTP